MIDSLKDKVAFVSGGSRGIGFACAMRLASGGANVFLVSSNLKKLKLSEKVLIPAKNVGIQCEEIF